MAPKSPRNPLPFEPRQKPKKNPSKSSAQSLKSPEKPQKSPNKSKQSPQENVPKVVSQRMARRMALFSGIPTALAMSSFFIFYWIIRQEWLEVPPIAVLLVSLGLFGLGVLGLSYGIFSASWDENRVGSWLGWQEFKVNLGQMAAAWRSKKEAKGN
jgi:hypothetical protein